jgi:hypothetical protein
VKRLLIVACLCLVTASCGGSGVVHVISAKELAPDVYGKGTQTGGARTQRVTVYFIRGKKLAPIVRTGPTSSQGAELVMRLLLDGPTADEKANGLSTAISENTELLSVKIDSGVANVNLSQQFERAADQDTQELRLAQVVFSLSELADVNSVHFFFEGESQPVLDESGRLGTIVSRSRYSRYAPEQFADTQINPCSLVEALGQCPQPTEPPGTPAPDTAP